MIPDSAQIEEFEQGSWVADLVSSDPFSSSFTLTDGSTWSGATVSAHQDQQQYFTRVVGGAGKLATVIPDKYYSGNVALSVAVADVCTACGESVGVVTTGAFLNNFLRIQGTAADALDALAEAFGQIWWIDRTGLVNMRAQRPTGAEATGEREKSDVDSALLVNPQGLTLGVGYQTEDPVAAIQQIRHIRWKLEPTRFSAQIYAFPFLFRSPAQTAYSCLYDAQVISDNGDGTIDVRVTNRFGVVKVPLYCGVPGSKVKTKVGEAVTLGFLAGDPQKPYAVAMAQSSSATKQVARNTDPVKVTIPALSFLVSCSGSPAVGVLNPAAIDVTGTIQGGTARLMVDDG